MVQWVHWSSLSIRVRVNMIRPLREVPSQEVCTVRSWVEYTTGGSCDQFLWIQVWWLPLFWLVVCDEWPLKGQLPSQCEFDALSFLFSNVYWVASEDIRILAHVRKNISFCSTVRLSPTWVTTSQSSYIIYSSPTDWWLPYSDGKIDNFSICVSHTKCAVATKTMHM